MLSVVVSLLSVIVAVMICLEFDEHIRMVGMTVLDVFFIRHLMWQKKSNEEQACPSNLMAPF